MHIGIDASRAFLKERTGTENYSYQLIEALAKIDREGNYRLYLTNRQNNYHKLPPNFHFKIISWPRFWTQGGLALECLKTPPDVLFIPAHTLPILRRPGLKTIVTIHDLGAEFLPEHHQFPKKLYLNKSTPYFLFSSSVLSFEFCLPADASTEAGFLNLFSSYPS